MPIRPELRQFYGAAHRADRAALIAEHGPICMRCGAETLEYLNLAHVTHDPRSTSRALWCASCHAANDAPHRIAVMRRRRAERHGQLWLMPEIEFDPYPVWLIPEKKLHAAAQGRLFA